MKQYQLFATTPKTLEETLATELRNLGAQNLKPTIAGVAFSGDLEVAYRTCLWSRCANRIFLVLSDFEVNSQDDLYAAVKKINWFEHMAPTDSFAVSFSAKNSEAIRNSHFGSLKVKDAVVDQMRAKFNKRPDIDTEQPNIRINVFLNRKKAQLSLDLSGESLHKRGYRDTRVPAPIKENLAAAILLKSHWPDIAKQQGSLLDPMCGSGTLLVEGAMIAADYAPGLMREYFGFIGWKKHDQSLWQQLRDEAEKRKDEGLKSLPVIVGFDANLGAISAAKLHIERAGLEGKIHIERRDIVDAKPADSWPAGLVICNPPYGERLGDQEQVLALYEGFGEILKAKFIGWQAAMIIGNPEAGFRLGIRSQKPVTLYNGALECKLLRMQIQESAFFIPKTKNREQRISQIIQHNQIQDESYGAEMFANRLRKNIKKLTKWAKRHDIHCYRLYDADLPEYAVAVDLYRGEDIWVHVHEYEPPKSIDLEKANQRLAGVMAEIPKVLEIKSENVYLKMRRKQKAGGQDKKPDQFSRFYSVNENGCNFLVNFDSYVDTGLLLDYRSIRMIIQQQAKSKHFLSLFAYTGSAAVNAAVGGALSTTMVDMSRPYLDWAKKNLELNNIRGDHQQIQNDCLQWLEQESQQPKRSFDLILLDPPTYSNSKRMQQAFDLQQEHVTLIDNAAKLLRDEGVLYFTCSFRQFKMDEEALAHLTLEDISRKTLPEDFARNPKIHYCWKITR